MFIERSVFYHMIVFNSVCHIIRIYRLILDVVGNVERSGHLSSPPPSPPRFLLVLDGFVFLNVVKVLKF